MAKKSIPATAQLDDAASTNMERNTDEFNAIAAWPYINQVETLLLAMDNEICRSFEGPEEKLDLNFLHNLLGATQTVAGELARLAGVR
jgi:hypothetical protein